MKSLYENEMKLEFLSKSNNEAFARISVAAFASQLDPTIEELADIKTAVSEAVTNCIIHGYEDTEGLITITCKIFANTILIEIQDNGKGIEDVNMAKEPLFTSKPDLERSRNGIYYYGQLYGRFTSGIYFRFRYKGNDEESYKKA